jgi:hypothetical protein
MSTFAGMGRSAWHRNTVAIDPARTETPLMARFQFNLNPFLAPRNAHRSLAEPALRELPLGEVAPSPQGPGWFDSSYELSCGLEVDEGEPGDDRYDDWLAARAIVERRLVAQRAATRTTRASAAPRATQATRDATAPDDFRRFGIDDLALA